MNPIKGKVWGVTRELFCKNNVEIHRLEVDAGGRSSKHYHEHKYNLFYVEKGKLAITVWKNDYKLIDKTLLTCGESTVVSPNEYHAFEAIDDTVVYEIYWVELSQNDIFREDCGGKL